MEPVLVDCDKNFNIDINQVYDLVKKDENIKAMLPVHLAGRPVDMLKIHSIADMFNLLFFGRCGSYI